MRSVASDVLLCVGRAGLAGAALQPVPFQGDREACGETALGQGRGTWAGILPPHLGGGGWFVQPWFLLIISGDCIWAAPRLTRGSCCGEGTPCSVEGGNELKEALGTAVALPGMGKARAPWGGVALHGLNGTNPQYLVSE